jgi:MFS family permease
VITSKPLRAGAAFVAAQPALLFGYALWGGIKELLGALLLALIAALLPWTLEEDRGARAALPLAAACAALVCVLSLPGAVWLAPALLAATVVVLRRHRRLLPKAGVFVAGIAVLAIPAYVAAVDWLPRIGNFDKATNLGNLSGPLSAWQLFGIWPTGDFRVHPHDSAPVYVLIAVVLGAGLLGLWWAWAKRGWELLAYVVIAGVGCALFLAVSSPWVGGKTLAMASPAVLAAALAGCAAAFGQGRAVEASVVALAITGGVLWSNALQYHDVWLAPRGQLHELETIGRDFAGQGPALMTNYEPYGARHFLRRLDPEGASELRRRFVYLTNGKLLDKGGSADIDRIRLDGLLVYRTLVLRRGPAASRPPSVYRLAWSGRYYEVWQRPQPPARTILEHLPLGNDSQAAAVPPCAAVLRLGGLGGTLTTATRPEAISLGEPPARGEVGLTVSVPTAGDYIAWMGGDWFGLASISVDGRKVGSMREELDWPGLYTDLGSVRLAAGEHLVRIRYETGGWRPGSGGTPYSFGPAALSLVDTREPVETTSDPRSLCGRRLDWVEAVR